MKPPAFQFYVDDFIGGTVALTTVEVGAYIRLLCYQWGTGSIPGDQESLTLIAGAIVSGKVIAKFPNGKNRRLEMERRKQKEYRDKQRLKGIASGVSRSNRGSTVVQPKANRGSTKPEPSSVGSRLEPEGNSPSPVSSLQSPNNTPIVPMVGLDIFEILQNRIGFLFGRPANSPAIYSEQSMLSEISRRPDVLDEMGVIEVFSKKPDNWFPQSVDKLLAGWQSTLDKARSYDNRTKINGRVAEKRVDRSIGTANEGVASQYKGLGRVAKVPDKR